MDGTCQIIVFLIRWMTRPKDILEKIKRNRMSGSISGSVLIMIMMMVIVIMTTNQSGSYAHGRTVVTLSFPLEISQKTHRVMDSDSSSR